MKRRGAREYAAVASGASVYGEGSIFMTGVMSASFFKHFMGDIMWLSMDILCV